MAIRITTLDNGLTVATDAMDEVGTIALTAVAGSGARAEQDNEHGLAHVLEHMAFKGTSRRSAEDIAEEIEQVGGDINAATGVEQTSYDIRCLAQDVPLAVDMLGDILIHPTFSSEELEREKNVITQEIGAMEDTPDDLVYEMMQGVCFSGQSLGRSILGTPKTVHALTRDDLIRFREHHYRAENMIVSAAGAVDHDALVAEVAEHFAAIGGGNALTVKPAEWKGGEARVERDLEQAHVLLAFPGLALKHDGIYAGQIFTNIMGGGMSSRLFREVRERRGLAYSIHSFHWAFNDTGVMGVYAGASEDDLPELLDIIQGELAKAVTSVTEREVARAKAQMRMSLELSREQVANRAERLARQLQVFGRPIDNAEILERLEAITIKDVETAGRTMLEGRLALAALGPINALPALPEHIIKSA